MSISSIGYGNAQPTNQTTNQQIAFKGTIKKTEKGNPYHHSNSAMKIGGTLGCVATAGAFLSKTLNDSYVKALSQNKEIPKEVITKAAESIKPIKNLAFIGSLLVAALHFTCAGIIDKKRNQANKDFADKIQEQGVEETTKYRNDIAISENGNLYKESDTGKKMGAKLGAIAGLIYGGYDFFKNKKVTETITKELTNDLPKESVEQIKTISKASGLMAIPLTIGIYALGGWLLGKWSDRIANNDANKNA